MASAGFRNLQNPEVLLLVIRDCLRRSS